MGVHCRHPLHGKTELGRVITPAAGNAILDPPTLAPPHGNTSSFVLRDAIVSTRTTAAASETQAQGAQKPLSAEGDSADFQAFFGI